MDLPFALAAFLLSDCIAVWPLLRTRRSTLVYDVVPAMAYSGGKRSSTTNGADFAVSRVITRHAYGAVTRVISVACLG